MPILRVLAALAPALLAGCVFVDVAKQTEAIDTSCTLSGSVTVGQRGERPVIVVLLRDSPGAQGRLGSWHVVDHSALGHAGHWGFIAGDGRYAVLAFDDHSSDLVYQTEEPYGAVGLDKPLECRPGARFRDLAISIPEHPSDPLPGGLDIAALQARSAREHMHVTLGQLTAVGEVAALSDERFSQARAESGVWRPYDFLFTTHPGIYFLEPYDPRKTPVVFVHGLNGSPANFAYLVDKLDRRRFQPWMYYYPSGAHLAAIADHFAQTMAKLEARHPNARYAVVAHSMGGLVARGFILRHARTAQTGRIPLFVSISTPWGGDAAAEMGVKLAPAVVHVWHDMAPGSDYLKSLYARALPPVTRHYLVFTYRRDSRMLGESSDRTVSVASQLPAEAQREAARLYGFDNDHDGVLIDPQVAETLDALLTQTF